MKPSDYIDKRNTLIDTYLQNTTITDNEYLNGQYTMVSAGLCNYLPSIDAYKHEAIFTKLLLHKKLSALEQSSHEALNYVTTENLTGETWGTLKNWPSIICTFHTGSYRLINLLLIKNHIAFTLVVGKGIIKEEGDIYKSQFYNITGNQGLTIIDAENPKAGIQMLRDLKKGKSLVLYIDGNTGTETASIRNDNRCCIDFLHQQIFARKGIAFLAHTANVPILPVVCYRKEWDDIRMKFYPPIFPDSKKEKPLFAAETTQKIYDLVAPVIQTYPEQWEAWLYLHKVARIINIKDKADNTMEVSECGSVGFNLSCFGVFKIGNEGFLFHKTSYTSYKIEDQLFNFLRKTIGCPVPATDIDKNLFGQLFQKKVLVYL